MVALFHSANNDNSSNNDNHDENRHAKQNNDNNNTRSSCMDKQDDLYPNASDSFTIPEGYGLLLELLDDQQTVELKVVPDYHHPDIHPNCYAPMNDCVLLYGGGSGSAVFGNQQYVMKHSGLKETKEVFALIDIQAQLHKRDPSSRCHMKDRLPVFQFVYISPYHLRNRSLELWNSVRHTVYQPGRRSSVNADASFDALKDLNTPEPERKKHLRELVVHSNPNQKPSTIEWDVSFHSVDLDLYEWKTVQGEDGSAPRRYIENGVEFLNHFCQQLYSVQELHSWKITLAQKCIGGASPRNGAHIHTNQQLTNDLLQKLIDEFEHVIQELKYLTVPDEQFATLEDVEKELSQQVSEPNVTLLSKQCDSMVGGCVLKNYHPETGRLCIIKVLGAEFRQNLFTLTNYERLPADFLGRLLVENVNLNDVFWEAPCRQSTLDVVTAPNYWLTLLQDALGQPRPTLSCIWTCGLTDAGLHNTFLSLDRGLEIFDLGRPTLEPTPAFLTKFLMSFFHSLGMMEEGQTWKVHFEIVDDKLRLKDATKAMMPYIFETFETVLDSFCRDLFDDNQSTRLLLIRYVILQLLSDAGFCLVRWEAKGGGDHTRYDRHEYHYEKWLWRTVWDIYVSCVVYARYLEGHP